MISDSGLVWSMNCDSCDEPKNSRTAAAAGLALIRSCGITVSISTELMRSRIARSMRSRPIAVLVLHQLADRAHAAVAEMVDVVDLAAAVLQVDQHLEDREDVVLAQHADVSSVVAGSRREFILTRPTADRS